MSPQKRKNFFVFGVSLPLLGLAVFLILLLSSNAAVPQTGPADRLPPEKQTISFSEESPRIAGAPSRGLFWIDAPDEELADFLLDRMKEEELLAQVFLLGWPSESAQGRIVDWIKNRSLGGVKIFGWNGSNVDTLAKTLGTMQAEALGSHLGIPLFTATDQEGGWVRHIKGKSSASPGNMAIGASGLAYDAYQSSALIAKELRAMGVNMNFAPTVDVYVNPEAHVIGPRSYGSDPAAVTRHSLAAFHGLEDQGIVATAKHFPGHGNAEGDSHGMMPIIQDKLEDIWNRDLAPYRALINEGIPAILVGHLSFPKISQDLRPATLSYRLNHELLREKLGFKGVVITDDLYMGGAWEYGASHGWRISDIVLESLKSGNDLVMLSQTPELEDAIWQKLRAAYRGDETFRANIRASVKRILLMKMRYLKHLGKEGLEPDAARLSQEVPNPESGGYFDEQAARAVTLVRGDRLPVDPAKVGKVTLIGQDMDFIRSGQAFFPRADYHFFSYEPFYRATQADIDRAVQLTAGSDLVIFALANPNSLQVLKALRPFADKIVVLSTLTPVYLKELPWVKNALAVYGWERSSFRYGFEALLGKFKPEGILPLEAFFGARQPEKDGQGNALLSAGR